jgi:SpoU rRNA methylase family enzyme
VVRRLLDLLRLVERHQRLYDLLVLQELEDAVRTNHDHTVLIAEGELYVTKEVHFI